MGTYSDNELNLIYSQTWRERVSFQIFVKLRPNTTRLFPLLSGEGNLHTFPLLNPLLGGEIKLRIDVVESEA